MAAVRLKSLATRHYALPVMLKKVPLRTSDAELQKNGYSVLVASLRRCMLFKTPAVQAFKTIAMMQTTATTATAIAVAVSC